MEMNQNCAEITPTSINKVSVGGQFHSETGLGMRLGEEGRDYYITTVRMPVTDCFKI